MKIDRITASINPAAIYGGVYDPKFKPYAIYAERLLAKLLQADAARARPSHEDPLEASCDAIIRAAKSFRGKPFTRQDLMTRLGQTVYNMPAAIDALVQDGLLEKGHVWASGARWVTYQVPK